MSVWALQGSSSAIQKELKVEPQLLQTERPSWGTSGIWVEYLPVKCFTILSLPWTHWEFMEKQY